MKLKKYFLKLKTITTKTIMISTILFFIAFLLFGCLTQTNKGKRNFSEREQIVEVVNKLFVYTDERAWKGLQTEVFDKKVIFDMVSAGAPSVETLSGQAITDLWAEGLKELDVIHHQAGNYIIEIDESNAKVKAYAIASHYKETATNERKGS